MGKTGPSTTSGPHAKEGIQLVSTRDPMKVAHPNNPHCVCVCVCACPLNCVFGFILAKKILTQWKNLPCQEKL